MNNQDRENNTVSARGQLKDDGAVLIRLEENASKKILFIGNSITRHGMAPHIGWRRDCGMAASDVSKDYVHLTVSELENEFGKISFCIAQLAEWEQNYYNIDLLKKYAEARSFAPDIIVVRIGENVNVGKLEEYDFAKYFKGMIDYFKREDSQVIVTNLFWKYDKIDGCIEKVANSNGYVLVKIGDLGELSEMKALGEYEHQGVQLHPNDNGMLHIAKRILTGIKG